MTSNTTTKNLDDIWKEVRQEFWDKTKPNFDIAKGTGQTGMLSDGPDSLMRKLENANAPPDERPSRDKAARAVRDVMKVLQLVGGLAATAAATVFSPAGMCFNAVNFLIDGAAKMKKFHTDLASLFTSIKAIMMRFKMLQRIEGVYKEVEGNQKQTLPEEMIVTTAKLMACFVKICLLAHKQMSRGGFKTAMVDLRVAFTEDDGGVRAELTKLEGLIKEQDSIKGTITLEEVMNSRKDIRQVLEKMSQHETETRKVVESTSETNKIVVANNVKQTQEVRLQRIAERLGIHSRKNDKEAPPVYKRQTDRFEETKQSRCVGTGGWLSEHRDYKEWWSSPSPVYPVLALVGEKDTGKTLVLSKAIDDWSTDGRVAIAYYFFGERDNHSETDRGESSDGPRAISDALRCMAYMFAKKNLKYAQDLEQAIDAKTTTEMAKMSPKDLWHVLNLSDSRTTAFVMAFDGLDQIKGSEEFIQHLAHLDKVAPVSATGEWPDKDIKYPPRFLITVNPIECNFATLESSISVLRFCDRDSIATRSEDPRNIEDLEKFIEETISAEDNLVSLFEDHQKLLAEFKKKLLDICDGKYSTIEHRIRSVNQHIDDSFRDIEDLRRIMLNDDTDDLDTLGKQVLNNLENTLGPLDIKQLNDVLAWFVWAVTSSFTLEEVDAIASLNKDSTTIQKFSQKIKRRRIFNKLFKQDNRTIELHDDLRDWLQKTEPGDEFESSAAVADGKPKISMTITIHQAEPKAVRRFLWDLHEKLAYDKSFFSASRGQIEAKGSITVKKISSYSKILNQCLDMLIEEEPEEETAVMKIHAGQYLPNYLFHAVKTMKENGPSPVVEFPEISAIITKLAQFLNSDSLASILKGCSRRGTYFGPWPWLGDADNVAALDELLNTRRLPMLRSEQRAIVKALLRKCKGPGGCLCYPVSQIGEAWLLDESWELVKEDWMSPFYRGFEWVESYLTMRGEWSEWNTVDPALKPEDDKAATGAKVPQADAVKDLEKDEDEVPSQTTQPVAVSGLTEEPKPLPRQTINLEPELPTIARRDTTKLPESTVSISRQNSLAPSVVIPSTPPLTDDSKAEGETAEREHPPVASRVAQAATWVQNILGLQERSAVFLERLGITYYYQDCFDEAIETLHVALEKSNCPARIHRRIAGIHLHKDRFDEAMKETEIALQLCSSIKDKVEQDAERLKNEKRVAAIHVAAKRPEDAIATFLDLIETNQHDWETYYDLLETTYNYKQVDKASKILDRLSRLQVYNEAGDTEVSHLTEFFVWLLSSLKWPGPELIVIQAHFVGCLDTVMKSLEEARRILNAKIKQKAKDVDPQLAALHLTEGYAKALKDREHDGFRKGGETWNVAMGLSDDHFLLTYTAAVAAANYHYSRLHSSPASEIRNIKETMEAFTQYQSFPQYNPVRTILAYAYTTTDQVEASRSVLRRNVESGLELLEDDDPDNDWEGYLELARRLAATGDTANAIAAWSMVWAPLTEPQRRTSQVPGNEDAISSSVNSVKPNESSSVATEDNMKGSNSIDGTQPELDTQNGAQVFAKDERPAGRMIYTCDGDCDQEFSSANDVWMCYVCEDVGFCPPCYEKLQNEQLGKWVCHKSHTWYHVPPYTDLEWARVPKGSVCIPKQLGPNHWSREQGELIEVDEWKKRIRTVWELRSAVDG